MDFPDNFVLTWNSMKDWNVIFTDKLPKDDTKFRTTINLRKLNKQLNVYGKIKHNPINNVLPRGMKKIYNKSLLKSNLQKCIRRGDIDKALITSANLILIDLLGFLRRLIIISIEDVCVTNNIGLLVWLMIAYPNYEITNEIIQYLLLTIYSLCTHSKKFIPDTNNDSLIYDKINYKNIIINSLIIREEFGGMKCDMALIRKTINSNFIDTLNVKTGDLKVTRNIERTDILKESIDFHCFPDMLYEISSKIGLSIDQIKFLIWENSSKYNIRENFQIIKRDIWEKLLPSLSEFQYNVKRKINIY